MRPAETVLLSLIVLLGGRGVLAQELTLAGSIRNYNLLRMQDSAVTQDAKRDINFLSVRVVPAVTLHEMVTFESHVVLDVLTPAQSYSTGLPGGGTQTFLHMNRTFVDTTSATVAGRLDRLSGHLHASTVDLTVGRQAITWGVNPLFPALDMYSPFAPTQIDRDYKTGVDAVRLTVSPRPHLQIEAVGAQLGSTDAHATAAGVMVRVNAGVADVGVIGGRFHDDTAVGSFVSMGLRGAVVRGEVSRTASGDPVDRLRRPSFWRAGVGVDRQLSSTLTLSAEVAYDGFGERHASEYPVVLATTRRLRGEIASPGQLAAGGTLAWHFHALGTLSTTTLLNLNDASAAVTPLATWSVNNRVDVLAGAQLFAGHSPALPGVPRSEYGGLGSSLVAGLKAYF